MTRHDLQLQYPIDKVSALVSVDKISDDFQVDGLNVSCTV